METKDKKVGTKHNPTESAALKRLEHDLIKEDGIVPATKGRHAIHCLTVIGTIEGHTLASDAQKTTKYEHVIPQLVDIEEDPEIEGLLVILNTVGGDVEAGLALAELIAGVSKPSATLVLGGGHSIGIPLAVAARHSFIVPTATMTVHPVRHSGICHRHGRATFLPDNAPAPALPPPPRAVIADEAALPLPADPAFP